MSVLLTCVLLTIEPRRRYTQVQMRNGRVETKSFYKELGLRIRMRRDHLGITQEQLAKRVKLARTSITNIEKGDQKPLAHTIVELAQSLNLTVGELLPGASGKSSPEHIPDKFRDTVFSVVPEVEGLSNG